MSYDYGHFRSLRKRKPIDRLGAPLPWYTYPAIEFLSQLDFSSSNLFEFGAGNSTLFWGRRAQKVVSVESDPDWFQQIKEFNSRLIEIHLKEKKDEYVDSITLHGFGAFPVVVVDGLWRYECAEAALKVIDAAESMVIVDNSDWYPDICALFRNAGMLQVDFHGFAPINAYTHTTTIMLGRKSEFHASSPVQPRPSLCAIPGGAGDSECAPILIGR